MTNVTAKWTLSDGYYQLVWAQGLRHRTKARRWIIPLGILLAVLGAAELTFFRSSAASVFIGTFLIVAGLIEVSWHSWDRSRWFKAMRGSPQHDGMVEMRFTPDGVTCSGPISKSEMKWDGIVDFVRADEGIFLGQGRGLSMFIPNSAFDAHEGSAELEALYRATRDAQLTR